ncbi:zincin-like metallopeptidase domain-containing protein [Pontibacter saemangeumensis]|uniref:Zincin-like metallopeptidase domain-containing protein n=1 Tax=Pontibacter saemangeumensis TaxID=1084525 RepID=A0ABP8M2P5_9BACT
MNAYEKFNRLAQQVTSEVIAQLAQGRVPWQQPWTCYGLPKNYLSGRPYEGFNAFYLQHVTEKRRFAAPYFLTFRQALELGGHVKKGEKGTPIVYWKIREGKARENEAGQGEGEKEGPARKFVPFIWTVFNIEQIAGADLALPAAVEHTEWQVIAACQQVVESYPMPRPHIGHGGTQAYYAPVSDRVQLPELKCFASPHAYHATLFHELIHSTGHPQRLSRFTEKAGRLAEEDYSKEELIAEMGASFLCAFTGIREAVFGNSVAYLKGWAGSLKDDKTMLLSAGTRAFRAASYILGLKAEERREALPPAAMAA